jgi:DNA-directed RNA polymerase specialized sigma24 family protein
MSAPPDDFPALLERLRNRDEDAWRELYDGCKDLVLRRVRRWLSKRVRPLCAEEDLAQDVWAAFFVRLQTEPFATRGHVLGFLCRVARNKACDLNRKRLDGRHLTLRRRLSLDEANRAEGGIPAPGPSACERVMAQDEWDNLARQRPRFQVLVDRLRQGGMQLEAALTLGLSERQVRRLVDSLRIVVQGGIPDPTLAV